MTALCLTAVLAGCGDDAEPRTLPPVETASPSPSVVPPSAVAGERFEIAFAEAPPADPDGSVIVEFRCTSDPYVERDTSGDVVREEPAQVDQDAEVKLVRRGTGWAVDAIRTVD